MNSKERYQRCKKEHRCPNCFNKHSGKFVYCDKCREWRKRYNPGRNCKDCGEKIPQGDKSHRCPSCKEKHNKTYWKSWFKDLPKEQQNSVRERLRDYARKWRKEHPEQYQDTTLKRRYNVSFYAAQKLYESQNGKCAICEIPIPELTDENKSRTNWAHVDHNHSTKKVRGLLCPSCNHLLGNCKEDVVTLQKAIQYLQKYS